MWKKLKTFCDKKAGGREVSTCIIIIKLWFRIEEKIHEAYVDVFRG